MTADEEDTVRRAIRALWQVRTGDLVLPADAFEAAWGVVESVAKQEGKTPEDILQDYDPDPRLRGDTDFPTLPAALLDLDEQERFHAVKLAHAMRLRSGAWLAENAETLPVFYTIIHDSAIVETATKRVRERRAAATNGNGKA